MERPPICLELLETLSTLLEQFPLLLKVETTSAVIYAACSPKQLSKYCALSSSVILGIQTLMFTAAAN